LEDKNFAFELRDALGYRSKDAIFNWIRRGHIPMDKFFAIEAILK